MIRPARFLAFACAALALIVPVSASAYTSAPLTFCNKTSVVVGVVVGYHSPGVNDPTDHSVLTGPYVSNGWFKVEPGACATLANPFSARYMFWYAASSEFNNVDINQIGLRDEHLPDSFCVTNYFRSGLVPDFTFEDENVSPATCGDVIGAPQGHNLWVHPKNADTWVNATVNFAGQY